jgi:hypothetical protein
VAAKLTAAPGGPGAYGPGAHTSPPCHQPGSGGVVPRDATSAAARIVGARRIAIHRDTATSPRRARHPALIAPPAAAPPAPRRPPRSRRRAPGGRGRPGGRRRPGPGPPRARARRRVGAARVGALARHVPLRQPGRDAYKPRHDANVLSAARQREVGRRRRAPRGLPADARRGRVVPGAAGGAGLALPRVPGGPPAAARGRGVPARLPPRARLGHERVYAVDVERHQALLDAVMPHERDLVGRRLGGRVAAALPALYAWEDSVKATRSLAAQLRYMNAPADGPAGARLVLRRLLQGRGRHELRRARLRRRVVRPEPPHLPEPPAPHERPGGAPPRRLRRRAPRHPAALRRELARVPPRRGRALPRRAVGGARQNRQSSSIASPYE